MEIDLDAAYKRYAELSEEDKDIIRSRNANLIL